MSWEQIRQALGVIYQAAQQRAVRLARRRSSAPEPWPLNRIISAPVMNRTKIEAVKIP
jgi:hypothetical protein